MFVGHLVAAGREIATLGYRDQAAGARHVQRQLRPIGHFFVRARQIRRASSITTIVITRSPSTEPRRPLCHAATGDGLVKVTELARSSCCSPEELPDLEAIKALWLGTSPLELP